MSPNGGLGWQNRGRAWKRGFGSQNEGGSLKWGFGGSERGDRIQNGAFLRGKCPKNGEFRGQNGGRRPKNGDMGLRFGGSLQKRHFGPQNGGGSP